MAAKVDAALEHGFQTLTPWSDLEVQLSKSTKTSIASLGFEGMTAVQAATIPLMLGHKDVAVEAVTGSGKTLAFVIPVVETLLSKVVELGTHAVGAVVVSPTCELATQIAKVLAHFVSNTPITLCCFTGGKEADREEQQYSLKGAHVVVATPGHLRELLGQRQCRLASGVRSLEILILDEADRLLDMGFSECVSHILSYLPKQRRTGLFSATQTRQLRDLVRAGLRNPVFVKVQETQSAAHDRRTPVQLQNFYTVVPAEEKLTYLVDFLQAHKGDKVMVFFATCAVVDYMYSVLAELVGGVEFVALHGKMKSKRQAVFAQFMELQRGVLLCTDVMARGVDFPSVSWVVQYDPPSTASAFVHRCGRTARMGHCGQALLLLQPHEVAYVDFLLINQKVHLECIPPQHCSISSVISRVRKMAAKDRALYEKGVRAFVSFVQSYGKHECGLLFQVKELKVGELAEGMGLLRVPGMPELRGIAVTGFSQTDLDFDSIRYKDKQRERQRQQNIARRQLEGDKMAAAGETAASREQGKEPVKGHGKELVKGRGKEPVKGRGKEPLRRRGKRGPRVHDEDELAELAEGARLLKKFKAGKISKTEFEERLEDL